MPLRFSLPHLPTPSLTGSLHLGLSVCLSGPACETPLAVSGTRPVGGRELIGAARSWGVGGAASGEAPGRARGGRDRALLHVAHPTGRLKGKCQLEGSHPHLLAAARLWGGQVCVFGGGGSPHMWRGPTISSRDTGSNPQIFQA